MLIDSRTLALNEVVNTEVCILGAGPAGISIAKEFIGQKFRVCILESGDVEFNAETASLGEGESVGDPFSPLHEMRHRQYGGMSNVWNVRIDKNAIGVRYVPLDAIDFEKRDWVPYSGWPICKADLLPYYERAHKFCRLGDFDYETAPWEKGDAVRTQFKGDRITSSMFKFGPSAIYFSEYRQDLSKAPNITTYSNANVVEIEADETAQTIKRVHAACLTGTRFTVEAKIFILATGGMENARLLLMSNKVQTKGLGNAHDVVGRYFMDHPLVDCGMLFPSARKLFNSMALYDKRSVNGETVMGKYALTEDVMRREKLLNMSAMVFPRNKRFKSQTKASAKTLFSSAIRGKLPSNVIQHLQNVIVNADDIVVDWYKYNIKKELLFPNLAWGDWSSQKNNDKKYVKFEVLSQTEQAPHPDNRVTLSDRLDKLGCPQVKLTNYWNELDIASVKQAQRIFAEEFTNAGIGRMEIVLNGDRPEALLSTHHSMGITRMNEDPKQGVVDAICNVHGITNLFIAGSSVFPTGGYANPTLTIVALCMRLSDHLKTVMNV